VETGLCDTISPLLKMPTPKNNILPRKIYPFIPFPLYYISKIKKGGVDIMDHGTILVLLPKSAIKILPSTVSFIVSCI